jgi:small subunit ribosomal protein S17
MKDNQEKNIKRRKLAGIVVSDRMSKTRVIVVTRLKKHPKYLKYFKATTKLKAHDEKNEYHAGDKVIIEETRPMSKEKRWKIKGFAQKSDSPAGEE